MSELRPTLSEWVTKHDECCACETMHTDNLAYCSCGQAERVAELAQLQYDLGACQEALESDTRYIAQLQMKISNQNVDIQHYKKWRTEDKAEIAQLRAESLENEGIVSEWQKAAHDAREYGNEWQRCAQAKDEQIARLRTDYRNACDENVRIVLERIQLRAELAAAQDESLAFKVIADLRAENKILTDALYTESVLKERAEKAWQLAVHEAVMATSERNLANHSLNECRRERDERTAVIADLRADLAAARKRLAESEKK